MNKYTLQKIIRQGIVFSFTVILLSLFLPQTTFAAGDAFFSFSPATGTYNVGDTIQFAISETSTIGDNVQAVESDLTYDPTILQYQSTSLTGPFTICADNSGGGGTVSLACASSATVSGIQSVATVSFTVLATGTGTITLDGTSDIDNNLGTSVWDTTLPSASYTLSNSSSSSSGGGGSSGGASSSTSNSCTSRAPIAAPDLFEVDVSSNYATLYFSPPGDPYDRFYIAFGNGSNSEGYSAQFSTGHSTGAIYYTVRELSPSSVYTFKVRGGNGCQPGPWSNTITVLTQSRFSNKLKKYYQYQQAPLIQSTVTSWYQKTAYFVSDHYGVSLPGAPDTGLAAPVAQKLHMKFIPAKQSYTAPITQKPRQSMSLWGNITNFFSGLFHR